MTELPWAVNWATRDCADRLASWRCSVGNYKYYISTNKIMYSTNTLLIQANLLF